MDLRKSEGLERVEKIFGKLNWHGFPGLQSLLLKVNILTIHRIFITNNELLVPN